MSFIMLMTGTSLSCIRLLGLVFSNSRNAFTSCVTGIHQEINDARPSGFFILILFLLFFFPIATDSLSLLRSAASRVDNKRD